MRIRPLLCLIIIMMGCSLLRSLAATEEDSHEELSVENKISDEKKVIELETKSEKLPDEVSTTVTTGQKGRSIRMIVGGQSMDGLAKQVTLPIDD